MENIEYPKKHIHIDDVFDLVGGIGMYQWCAFFIIGTFSLFGVESIAMNFVGGHQDHWCDVEELGNLTHEQQQYIAIPYDSDGDYHECKMFHLNYSQYSIEDFLNWTREDMVNDDTPLTDCGRGWVYDQSEYVETITSKLDLVCDDQWMVSMISTCFMAGILVGAVASGYASDKFGRKNTIYASTWLKVICTLMTVFPLNYPWVAVTRFLLGVGSTGAYLTGFILIMELVDNKWRGALGVSYQQQFAIGFMLWPGVAYFIRDDIKLQLAMAGPVIILLVMWWFTDSLMYYALSLNTGSLPGGIYFTTFLAGAVEVPANLVAVFFMGWRYSGRRFTCSLSLVIAGTASLVSVYVILEKIETAQTVLAMVSKAFVTVGFSSIYVFTSELFPTEVRNVGVGSASMCARVAGMIAPYMGPSLEDVWVPLPSVLCGSLAIISGLLTLLLPETLDQPLFTTVEEAEAFGSDTMVSPIVAQIDVEEQFEWKSAPEYHTFVEKF